MTTVFAMLLVLLTADQHVTVSTEELEMWTFHQTYLQLQPEGMLMEEHVKQHPNYKNHLEEIRYCICGFSYLCGHSEKHKARKVLTPTT